ncbi:ATP-binding protein [Mucilaginibacter ginkgonis]|uniref:histidine kinase n=1 Tax=Mucilaginibacter ginkgonis TaxID=2682091 RepID=A0A6I4ING2_9SPHI|nr:ATP-binding protein [Mucilaginibacter ginkgonis]QQL49497.1 PAS domain-containing protein [Mucilaginibacter ginkgonis]
MTDINPNLSSDAILAVLATANTPTAIYTNRNLNIQFANDGMLRIWGKGQDVIGKSFLEAIPQTKEQPISELLQKVWDTGKPLLIPGRQVNFVLDNNLSTAYFDFEFQPLLNADGKTHAILHTAADVTDIQAYKRLSDEKSDRYNTLNKMLTEGNAALQADNAELFVSNTALTADKDALTADKNALAAHNARLNADNDSLTIDNAALTADNTAYKNANAELDAANKNLNLANIDGEKRNKKLNTANADLTTLNDLLNVANERLNQLAAERQNLNEELTVTNEELALLNDQYLAANDELTRVGIEKETLNENLAISNFDLNALNEEYLATNEQLTNLNEEHQRLNEELKITNEELIALNEELSVTSEELHTLSNEHIALNEELVATNEELATRNDEYLALNDKLTVSLETAQLSKTAANLGTFDLDVVNDKLEWDDRCKELFGISPNIEVTYSADFVTGLHPDDRNRILQAVADAYNFELSGGKYDVEYRTVGAEDKKLRWVRAIGQVSFDADNKPLRFIGTVIEITEQKEDDQRKNDFIGMVSHELKTPLTSLAAYLQLLLGKAKKSDDSFSANALERSFAQVKKMTKMINGFLNVSRLESGKIFIDRTPFDIADLLKEVAEETKTIVTSHNVVFELCESIGINADKDKIGQVISNFISNAAKYSSPGTAITVNCVAENGKVKLSVTDQGMGIELQDQHKLFDRFYRVEGVQTSHISGFGIGLYLCAEIIERHNGKIGVDSVIGKGSTFWFTLPAVTK